MATIQIRNVPDEAYRTYRVRAATAGMSLQEYLLAELIRNASLKTPAEVAADVEAELRTMNGEGFVRGSSADLIRSDRDSR